MNRVIFSLICSLFLSFTFSFAQAQSRLPSFKVIAFFTAKHDLAHISFVHEANRWFYEQGKHFNFTYDSTQDWNLLDTAFLKQYQVVIFLDTRPDSLSQRTAFEYYIEHGGAWMGFHFAAFALTPSSYPQNWDWYHNTFLGSGEYLSNTWRPTSAILQIEAKHHPALKQLPSTFTASPNEWYRWKNDLARNPDIQVLLSIHPSSFPLGTGPKPSEIWHDGYYPVAWTNKRFRMVYFNMGHNDIDYETGSNRELSQTLNNKTEEKLIIQSLLWLGKSSGYRPEKN